MTENTPVTKGLLGRAYDDVASPAAKEIGGTLGAAVHVALSPANLIIRSLQEAVDYAEERVKERFARWRTATESIQPPPPEIAAPAIQALRFANQDDALREMYLNLLARSMDSSSVHSTHPAFADIIRQVSASEARALSALAKCGNAIPLVEIRVLPPGVGGWHTVIKHLNALGRLTSPEIVVPAEAIENFVRVGLLVVHEMHHVSDDEGYQTIEQGALAQQTLHDITESGRKFGVHRYMAEVTNFGAKFLRAVTDPNDEHSEGVAATDAA